MTALSPEILLLAYAQGVFPMADARDDPDVFWVDPRQRGILPLDGFHISRSLARKIRRGGFDVTFDHAFADVMLGCAAREDTWINGPIHDCFGQLHRAGHAHSVEIWRDGALIGGVYGLHIGAAFFGESMFSRAPDASKIALAYLLDRLRSGGFTLFDTQFITPHLASLGAVEIPRAAYHRQLARAVAQRAHFAAGPAPSGHAVVQRMTQTS